MKHGLQQPYGFERDGLSACVGPRNNQHPSFGMKRNGLRFRIHPRLFILQVKKRVVRLNQVKAAFCSQAREVSTHFLSELHFGSNPVQFDQQYLIRSDQRKVLPDTLCQISEDA